MSTTEEDLEASVVDDVVEELTADDIDADGPSTAEIDALDESLVESLEEYVADDNTETALADHDVNQHGDQDVEADLDTTDVDVDVDDDAADAASDEDADDATAGDAQDAHSHADHDAATEADIDTDIDADEASAADDDAADDEAGDVDLSGPADADAVFDDADFTDEDFDDDDQTFEVPSIVMATDDDVDAQANPTDGSEQTDDIEARVGDVDLSEVSDDILEELRRADIDGPVVDAAPQDDTTSAKRRPKKPVDYDPAPVPVPLKVPRILGRKARVRKVTRVVRHVDPWSVFKIAIVAHLVLYLILLTAGVLLWNVAYATGTIENVERFFESFGWQSFEFNGGEIYHAAWIAGLFGVLGLTGIAVLLATLFNLITDLVGGMRFTVLEEEVVESRTSPMRRFVVRRPEPEIPAVMNDGTGPLIREAVVDETGDIER